MRYYKVRNFTVIIDSLMKTETSKHFEDEEAKGRGGEGRFLDGVRVAGEAGQAAVSVRREGILHLQ